MEDFPTITIPHLIASSTGLINGRRGDPAPTPVSGIRMKTPSMWQMLEQWSPGPR